MDNQPPVTASTPNQTKNIVIIEDETFIADIYAREFTKAGFQVKVANDGPSGLKLLTEERFDILLLDIMLPGMHGLEVLRQWRIKNPSSNMPVLLLTNLGQDEVIKEAFNLGAQGYLIKSSYTPQQVVAEVKNALSGQPPKNPIPAS
ncbi:response regulator [Patescibacteria group bacterium]|nr:response regulator [Patescibacteria group bacterium]MCL5409681.1 response regulator [Patescibacteria group bacterium]